MTQNNIDIGDIRFEIPDVLFNYPWDEDIEINQGETALLLQTCKEQSSILKKTKEWSPTPETIAWVTLWTRNLNLMQSAISILESRIGIAKAGQRFALRILWRPAFELYVTLNYILSESSDLIKKPNSEKFSISHRLCGYLAWCLWNDKELSHKFTQKWRLDTVYGKNGPLSPENEELYNQAKEFFWGDVEPYSYKKDQEKKKEVREISFNERTQFIRWLRHEKLNDFYNKIQRDKPRTYFSLIDPENRSLASLLSSSMNDAGYPLYQEASTLIHGSTFKEHTEMIGEYLYPLIVESDEFVQRQAGHVRRYCRFNFVTISKIQDRMEREELINFI